MTLAEELTMRHPPDISSRARMVTLSEPRLRLPFNGQLSVDEITMAEQGAYDYGPVPWE